MSSYHRHYQQGAHYFFTVVTYQRKPIFNDQHNIQILREAFKKVIKRYPFKIDAIVILPDHLHCILKLPDNDSDYSSRWREIKKIVSKKVSSFRNHRNECNIWQRRFWEHAIKHENDWRNHMDYIHFNPVKHGYVSSAKEWEASSFKECVKRGMYDLNWGSNISDDIKLMDFE